MTEHVSPLRRRMIDDMATRNMSPNTQKAYVRAVQNFSRPFMKSPYKLLTLALGRRYHQWTRMSRPQPIRAAPAIWLTR